MRTSLMLAALAASLALAAPAQADRLVPEEDLAKIAALLNRDACEQRCESTDWRLERVAFPAGYTPPGGSTERLYLATVAPRQCGVGRCISAYVLRETTRITLLKEGWNLGVVERITAQAIPRPEARASLLRVETVTGWHLAVVPGSTLGTFRHGTYPSLGQRTHIGVDLVAPCGTPVQAWEAGEIVDVIIRDEEANRLDAQGRRVGIGYMVLLRHDDLPDGRPLHSIYLHLQGPPAKRSGRVERGEVIGAVGNTGAVIAEHSGSGCHLHFELRHFRSRFHPVWRNIYGEGDQRRSAEFLNDWSDPEVLIARGQRAGTATQVSAPAVAPGPASSPEANALFVRASMVARRGSAASGSEQVRLYREALALFDRIVTEHPGTDLARRIAAEERLGQVDIAELRRVVREDPATISAAAVQAAQTTLARFRQRYPQAYAAIWNNANLSEVAKTGLVLALEKIVQLGDSPEVNGLLFSKLQTDGRSFATWALRNPETAVRLSAERIATEWTEGLVIGVAGAAIADMVFQAPPMSSLPSHWRAPLRALIEAGIVEFASVARATAQPSALVAPLFNRAVDVYRIAQATSTLARTQDAALAATAMTIATAVELAESYPSTRSRDIAADAMRQARADVETIVGRDDAAAVRQIVDLTHRALVAQTRGDGGEARRLVQQILQLGKASGNIHPFSAILRPVDWLTAVARGGRDSPERAAEIMIAFTTLNSLTVPEAQAHGGAGTDRGPAPSTSAGWMAVQPSEPGYPSAVGQSFRDCPECPEMVVIPAGRFVMGSPNSEEGRNANEGPQREVVVRVPLAVSRHPITVAQYRTFAQATGRGEGQPCRVWNGRLWEEQQGRSWRNPGFAQENDHPVVCMSWEDAKAYAEWLSGRTGQRYRLLTEAEWEYAARGGTTTRWWWGEIEADQCRHANGADETTRATVPGGANWKAATAPCTDGYAYTAPSGRFLANPFGLHDMGGNVFQWVEDCSRDNYEGAPADASLAVTSGDCVRRVLRGGAWIALPRGVRSANRLDMTPSSRLSMFGFRLARMP